MKTGGKIFKRNDGSFLLMMDTQPIPNKIIFYVVDEHIVKIKNNTGQYRTLIKSFEDARIIIVNSELIGFKD